MLNIKESQALLNRAYQVIPSATQTFSKGPTQWPRGVSPHYLSSGDGAWVYDVDGNKYLDHLMALGAIILGYKNQEVNNAIKNQVDSGLIFSQMHPLEVELAEKLVDLIPSAEMVKFLKNGSDATTAAVRVARAYTGRTYIAQCGYHGWHDWHIAHTTRAAGVPSSNKDLVHSFVYNDLQSLADLLEQHDGKFAAVIMEPVGIEQPNTGYLASVKALCEKHGTLLIFDEIVTGFRFDIGGYQSICKVTPHLSCFGKGMANGMPLAAVVGLKDIMMCFDSKVFVSGTFGGETGSLAASCKTIEILSNSNALELIKNYGGTLMKEISTLISSYNLADFIQIKGFPQRSILLFKDQKEISLEMQKTYFMQECIKENLLYFCSHVPCAAHQENELKFTLNVLEKVFAKFSDVMRRGTLHSALEAQVIEPIFRKP